MNGQNGQISKAIVKNALFYLALPIIGVALMCCGAGWYYRGVSITLSQPAVILDLVMTMVSTLVGFLFTFVGISFGFTSSVRLKRVFRYIAPKVQFWIAVFVPLMWGVLNMIGIIALGVIVPDKSVTISVNNLAWAGGAILIFLLSYVMSTITFVKFIGLLVREQD